jgi:hypothetical protein
MFRTFPLLLALCCASCTDDGVTADTSTPEPDPPSPACEVGVELSGTFSAPRDAQIPATFTIGLLQLGFDDGPQPLDKPLLIGTVQHLEPGGSAPWTVCLPEVPADSWFSEAGAGDEDAAAFIVGAWTDRVQDGIPGMGETLIGAEFTLVGYVRGDIDQELANVGGEAGWNVVGMDFTGETEGPTWAEPIGQGYTTYDVEANLAPRAYPSLSVTVGPSSEQNITVGLYAMHEMFDITPPKNATVAATIVTADGDTTVELTGFDGAPPSSHLIDGLDDGNNMLAVAVYAGVAFVDANQNWQFDQNERLLAASFTDEEQVSVVYMQPRHFFASLYMEQEGVVAGWSIGDLSQEGWPRELPWASGLHLSPVD